MPIHRILLLPFAFIYTFITDFRNYLYDNGTKKSHAFDRFIISVGNLTAGGTGKTPFVELLIRMMKDQYQLSILSRGYKRKTKGFRIAGSDDDSTTLGDEPFQYFSKYGNKIKVAVGEKRALAIPQIIVTEDEIEVIILDDAYQHRSVKPNLNILLNDYTRPFYTDYVIPAGLLRESRKNAKRADIIVVTKCPDALDAGEMNNVREQIHRYSKKNVPVYFSGIRYLKPQRVFGTQQFSKNIFLFSGIGNTAPLQQYVEEHFNLLNYKRFPDHHSFTSEDLKALARTFNEINSMDKCLLTTEKDMVRLMSMKEEAGFLLDYPVFYLPIELYFLENGDFFADYLNNVVGRELKNVGLK